MFHISIMKQYTWILFVISYNIRKGLNYNIIYSNKVNKIIIFPLVITQYFRNFYNVHRLIRISLHSINLEFGS